MLTVLNKVERCIDRRKACEWIEDVVFILKSLMMSFNQFVYITYSRLIKKNFLL